MAKFVITKRINGDYQFTLKDNNGQIVLSSEGYSKLLACENGIDSVKINGSHIGMFDKKHSANGHFYFTLKARNGQIIGVSQMYESAEGCDRGINRIIEIVNSATTMHDF